MPTRASWRRVLAWLLASRAVIAAIGVIGAATFLDQRSSTVAGPLALHFDAVWRKWDVLWYERIALHGYGWHLEDIKGQAVAGFFPGYPLLVGLVLRVLPRASFFWTGLAASNLFTAAALALAVEHLTTSSTHARRFLLVMATAAGSFYLSIPYTESLFLLLVVATIVLTRRGAYLAASATAGLSAVTRVQGLALFAVPLIACRLDESRPLPARFARIAAMALTFAVPVAIYMTFLHHVQGSAEAFIARQELWDNALPYPFKSAVGLVLHPLWLSGWLHAGYWIGCVVLLVRYWRRLPLGEALFCAGALLISTQQESFHGIYRYAVPLVPLSLALADDRREWRDPIVMANVIFGVIMILAFVTWNRLAV